MKVVILAGGFGTRLSEETDVKPKPMVEIGEQPILWHVMKIYSHYGFNEFVILLGYKGAAIKQFFADYCLLQNNVTFDLKTNTATVHNNEVEPWKVTLLDTGLHTMTGGRLKRAAAHISDHPFLLTYGDGLADVDIRALVDFHQTHGKLLTVTAVQPAGRYGALNLDDNSQVQSFFEKPKGDNAWINGGFFVCQPQVLQYIKDDSTVFEQQPLNALAAEGEMMARKHHGFWACMDTLKNKKDLSALWQSKQAPWACWRQ